MGGFVTPPLTIREGRDRVHGTSPYHNVLLWLPCAKGAVSQRLTEGLYGVLYHFFAEKMVRVTCGKIKRRDNRGERRGGRFFGQTMKKGFSDGRKILVRKFLLKRGKLRGRVVFISAGQSEGRQSGAKVGDGAFGDKGGARTAKKALFAGGKEAGELLVRAGGKSANLRFARTTVRAGRAGGKCDIIGV